MNANTDMAPKRRTTTAHRKSVEEPLADVIATLRDEIGANLLAYVVDKSSSTVNRWITEKKQALSPSNEAAIRTLYQVRSIICESDGKRELDGKRVSDGKHVLRAWLIGFNPQLEDETPADKLKNGEHREALAAARAFAAGG